MLIQVILPVIAILVIVVLLNCPIYIALLGATVYLQVFVNNMPIQNLFTGIFESLSKNTLMAVPFFILAGSFIAHSTLGKRLMDVCVVLLKRVKGGLPIACVLANAVFGAISGSSSASTATFGKIIYEPLEENYGEKLSLGVLTSSASLSVVIPPSIPMIIYGVVSETSIAEMFKAGFLPGILIVVILSIYLRFVSRSRNFEVSSKVSGEFKKALIKSIPVIILPVIVLGSVYGGISTPTEIGAISAVYCLIISLFVLRDLKLRDLLPVFKGSAKITAQVFLLVAMSSVFAQAATITRLPQYVTSLFEGLQAWQFLLMLNILLIIIGCFFDTIAAILVFVPMLLPAALALGISPVHFGIIFVVNLSIGMFTPPFGINIFVAQSVIKKPMGLISKACIPFIFLYIISLILITYIPQIALLIPELI